MSETGSNDSEENGPRIDVVDGVDGLTPDMLRVHGVKVVIDKDEKSFRYYRDPMHD